jgi:multidrug efflux pump subunit AcrB
VGPQRGWSRFLQKLDPPRRTRTWAIIEANRTRLRPILMTTLMLIAGMIPIALGVGPGSASRASMAKVIVGGQAMSLLLSLLVTPVAYSLFDDIAMWRKRRRAPRLASTRRIEETEPVAIS